MNIVESCKNALIKNNFEVFIADNPVHANKIFFKQIFPAVERQIISWGDSITLQSTEILETLLNDDNINIIKTFERNVEMSEIIKRRKQALLSDLFLTGTNAVTECGKLVNLDMIGNRIGGINFGPKNVVIFVGINKIVPNLIEAFNRIKNISAPLNAKRHFFKTPCAKTGKCHNCDSPQRICNSWHIVEKSYPKKRIKIIIINKQLGM